MNNIREQITRIAGLKSRIRDLIITNGVPVNINDTIDKYPNIISSIKSLVDAPFEKRIFDDYLMGSIDSLSNNKITQIMPGAFRQKSVSELLTINLPNVTAISNYAFYGDQNLMDLLFDDNQWVLNLNLPNAISIGNSAFLARPIVNLTLPNVTSIGDSSFRYCSKIKKIDLSAVESIGGYAFEYCGSLETVIFRCNSLVCPEYTSFANTPFEVSRVYVYVPRVLVETYNNDTYWTAINAKIRAIEDYPEICGE